MGRSSYTDYSPVRPPLSARWTEWSALLRSVPRDPEMVAPDAIRRVASVAGPVLVLPGLARGDSQTSRLRRHLTGLGFDARGWGLGIDIGPTRRVLDGLDALLRATADTSGPVNLVGLSMGGLFARWDGSTPSCFGAPGYHSMFPVPVTAGQLLPTTKAGCAIVAVRRRCLHRRGRSPSLRPVDLSLHGYRRHSCVGQLPGPGHPDGLLRVRGRARDDGIEPCGLVAACRSACPDHWSEKKLASTTP